MGTNNPLVAEKSDDLLAGDETVLLVLGLHQIPDNIVPYPKSV